jgi:hypothetical protein
LALRSSRPHFRPDPKRGPAFFFDEIPGRVGSVYLWKNIDAAKQAHGPAFQDRVNAVFGAKPEFKYFETLS